jgi:hypothetical protein
MLPLTRERIAGMLRVGDAVTRGRRRVGPMIGRAINAFRGRFEAFWSPGRPCMVQLLSRDDSSDTMVYVMLTRYALAWSSAWWTGPGS